MDVATAGTAIELQLVEGGAAGAGANRGATAGAVLADYGAFWTSGGAGEIAVSLPAWLPARDDYAVRGTSAWDHGLSVDSPPLAILASPRNAVAPPAWAIYP